MAEVLSLPFRISKHGEAMRSVQGTENYYSEQISTLILTLQGERELEPTLGMPDIAFDGFKNSAFHSQLQEFLPDVKDAKVSLTDLTDTTQNIAVRFEIGVDY